MKKIQLFACFLLAGISLQAQTLQEALKKTENERFELARADFQNLVKANPTNIEYAFFYGNFFLTVGEKDAAIAEWKRAGGLNAEDKLGKIAAAKALYFAGDTAIAGKMFCDLIKATKSKNALVFHRIGETYFTAPLKNLAIAESYLRKAVKLDEKNIDGIVLLGDILLAQSTGNATSATEQYNKALALNQKAANIIVRKAKIYQGVGNYDLANQEYQAAQAADPTYAPAYAANAELNVLFERYNKAIELWKKYIELNDNVEARYRYTSSMFEAKKYADVLPELDNLTAKGFENLYTKRMRTYALYETSMKNDSTTYQAALAASNAFFATTTQDKIIALDYKYRGQILNKLGQDSLAVAELEKGMSIDAKNATEYLGSIAKIYYKARNNDKAIEYYSKKQALAPEKMDVNELYELGRAYYFSKTPNYELADSNFAQLTRLAPNFLGGYYWRARANFKMDDQTNKLWLPKVHYEAFIAKLKPEDLTNSAQKNYIMEASKYLGDYYVNSPEKNKEKAIENWTRVQTLDPNDKQAKAFFDSPLGKL
jgi:tetratricopeptide (TPR) repeat protein